MPLFGPLEGSEGTILIPERGPGGDFRTSRERGEREPDSEGSGLRSPLWRVSGVLWAELLGIREAYPLCSCTP
jgi:hypothetical protein